MNKNLYARYRFPAEVISHCVWLYNSFSLSLRDIEKMMLYRGIKDDRNVSDPFIKR